ncbi:MAG: hypothetical protein FWD46_09245 [Cystobacterineae bacterium]|nr:hypothetical protein [Cystobacterineae bacterium]
MAEFQIDGGEASAAYYKGGTGVSLSHGGGVAKCLQAPLDGGEGGETPLPLACSPPSPKLNPRFATPP